MNAVLQDQPLPARLLPWPRALDTTLGRCLLLAVLLHLWLVALLGNAPGGTALPGQGVAGVLNVTLRGPPRDGPADVAPPAEALNRAPGDAPTPRWGGQVRQTDAAPDSLPGAAHLGLPAAQQPDAVPAPSQPAQPTPAPAATAPAAAAVPAPLQPAPPTEPVALPESRLGAVAPLPAPAAVAPALARETPLPQAAVLPELPAPTTAVPLLQRQLASPLTRPAAVAAPPLPTTGAEAVALPALPAAALPATAAVPPSVRQLQARPPEPNRAAEPSLPSSLPVQPVAPDLPTVAVPALSPMPVSGVTGAPLPAVGTAAPDAGTRVGQDVATPAAAASAPPRLNLQLARPRGGELSRYDTRGALPVLPRPPERDDKLAREIEKAGKADCRQAHSDKGLLAVIPLAVDALRKDGGCKW